MSVVATSLAAIFGGCVLNNLALEFIVSKRRNEFADKDSGGFLTLLQFALIALLSVPYAFTWRGGGKWPPIALRGPVVPLREYLKMSALFFVMSYLNNLAFSFNISQPLHMVFRSSQLVVSYLFGWAFMGKRYTYPQLAAVILLTLGAASATAAEILVGDTAAAAGQGGGARAAAAVAGCVGCGDTGAAAAALGGGSGGGARGLAASWAAAAMDSSSEGGLNYLLRWWMGIGILTACLIFQTLLGALQDASSKAYGKAPYEAMFFFHAFSIFPLLFTARDAPARALRWAMSPPAHVILAAAAGEGDLSFLARSVMGLGSTLTRLLAPSLSIMWLHVLLNMATQYVCLVGVYNLIACADQLTVNVALTVRKFISLMLSVWIFGNTFTVWHWIGAVCVISGGCLFSLVTPDAKKGVGVGKVEGASGGGTAAEAAAATTTSSASGEGEGEEGEGSAGGAGSGAGAVRSRGGLRAHRDAREAARVGGSP